MTEISNDADDISASISPIDIAERLKFAGLGHMARLAIFLKVSELLQGQFKIKDNEPFGWTDVRKIFCPPCGFIYVAVYGGKAVETKFSGSEISIKGEQEPSLALRSKIMGFIDSIDTAAILEQARERLEGQNLEVFDNWVAGRYAASLKLGDR